jgi:hypothetical protein
MCAEENRIAEIQGTYGPITVSEMLIQKIWMRRDFEQSGLKTQQGSDLKIIDPGTWNLQGGPDFKDAILEIAGARVEGDVEVHFYARDWRNHGHFDDPSYNEVVLHVVLFEPAATESPVATCAGSVPNTFVLLPWLRKDLEEYAEDDAILGLEQRDQSEWIAPLLREPVSDRRRVLVEKSAVRYRQKVEAARKRIERFGWRESCHISCMEILGCRHNRAAMAALALRFSLDHMAGSARAADAYLSAEGINWNLNGMRPANRPERRIRQYCEILKANPDWPSRLRAIEFPSMVWEPLEGAAEYRKQAGLSESRRRVADEVLSDQVGGTRLDTLVCDGFLPLLAASRGTNLKDCWQCWYRGDSPDSVLRFVRATHTVDGRIWPLCNGLVQGGIQWLLENT